MWYAQANEDICSGASGQGLRLFKGPQSGEDTVKTLCFTPGIPDIQALAVRTEPYRIQLRPFRVSDTIMLEPEAVAGLTCSPATCQEAIGNSTAAVRYGHLNVA